MSVWGCRRQGASSCTTCIRHPIATAATTSKRWNPPPVLYLSLHACSGWWMGSLVWLVSLEQAIRTPGPCEIIPPFNGIQPSGVLRALELPSLSLTHISALSLFIFPLCAHSSSLSAERDHRGCVWRREERKVFVYVNDYILMCSCMYEHMREINIVWLTRLNRGRVCSRGCRQGTVDHRTHIWHWWNIIQTTNPLKRCNTWNSRVISEPRATGS